MFDKRPTDVLIVDDNADFAEFVRQVVISEKMTAAVLLDSTKFESMFRTHRPNIVVLDIEMPGASGMQLAQWLGNYTSERGLEVALLIISGFGADVIGICGAVADLAGIEVVRGLSKPVERSTLVDYLNELRGRDLTGNT